MALNAKSIKYKDTSSYKELLDIVWPVGSTYLTTSDISPSQTLGGTWVEKKDGMIAACGTNTYGYSGKGHGELQGNITITTKHMPSHTHGVGTYSMSKDTHKHMLARPTLHNNGTQSFESWPFVPYSSATTHFLYDSTQDYGHTHTLSGNSASTGEGQNFIPYSYSFHCWVRTA